MAIKAKELAKMLGVSQATISLVLNKKPGISEKTRMEVRQKIESLGYGYMFAGEEGRSVSTAVSEEEPMPEAIGFVIFKRGGELVEQTPFFPLILTGVEKTAKTHGYHLFVINFSTKENLEEQMNYIIRLGCKGIVIFATEMIGDDIEPFLQLDVPFVLLDNYYIDRHINSVALNNEQGTYALVEYLYRKGHRKIGYLGSRVNIASFIERKESYFRALRKFGLHDMEPYCVDIGYPESNACDGLLKLLRDGIATPTAYISENDVVAYGAVMALKAFGLRVPEDISVVGFDDRPICTLIEPTLTTVRIPRFRFGSEAVELLVNKIRQAAEKVESHVKVEVCVELIERESVRDISEVMEK